MVVVLVFVGCSKNDEEKDSFHQIQVTESELEISTTTYYLIFKDENIRALEYNKYG